MYCLDCTASCLHNSSLCDILAVLLCVPMHDVVKRNTGELWEYHLTRTHQQDCPLAGCDGINSKVSLPQAALLFQYCASMVAAGLTAFCHTSQASADFSTAGMQFSCLSNQAMHVFKCSNAASMSFGAHCSSMCLQRKPGYPRRTTSSSGEGLSCLPSFTLCAQLQVSDHSVCTASDAWSHCMHSFRCLIILCACTASDAWSHCVHSFTRLPCESAQPTCWS